jgi:predicted DNA binding CopG/RHH family protein
MARAMNKTVGEPMDIRIVADHLEEDAEVSEMITRLEAEADRDIAGGTVTLRWGREQIAVVKRAAAIMGIPYQTYLKQVVFKQAIADIEHAHAALSRR